MASAVSRFVAQTTHGRESQVPLIISYLLGCLSDLRERDASRKSLHCRINKDSKADGFNEVLSIARNLWGRAAMGGM